MIACSRMLQRLAAVATITTITFASTAAAAASATESVAEPATEPAAAAIPSAWTETGNITAVSDYLFRGISQTQAKPTAQASIDFTHSSGAYLGLFGSGVSHAAYNNGAGSELDVYGGYRYALDADTTIDAGLVTYWFPGAHYATGGKDIKYHTQEAKLGVNIGSFNATAWVSLSRYWFGFTVQPGSGELVDTRGTVYGELNWNPMLSPGLVLNLHAGRQQVRHMDDFNFYDARVGVTKTVGNWAFAAAGVYNSGDASKNGTPLWTFFNADGSSKNVVQKRLLVTATRNF